MKKLFLLTLWALLVLLAGCTENAPVSLPAAPATSAPASVPPATSVPVSTPLTGWQEEGGIRYYIDVGGNKLTGWQTLDGNRYYFSPDGSLYTGWLEENGERYYLLPDGRAARGRVEIEGVAHHFIASGAEILLVNSQNPLPEAYDPQLVPSFWDVKINQKCDQALREMLNDCIAAGNTLFFCSAYRDPALQEFLFNRQLNVFLEKGLTYEEAWAATAREVAVPGTSEHHTGLAVDLVDGIYQELDEKQAETPTQQWLMAHCWEYGFILRYPVGKTDSTGIIYEPWHYRYVGVELAMELKESGQSLEEYLESLTNS